MEKLNIALFMRQVRQEIEKVTWPSRQETITFTIVIIVSSILLGIFFFFIDQLLAWILKLIFGL